MREFQSISAKKTQEGCCFSITTDGSTASILRHARSQRTRQCVRLVVLLHSSILDLRTV